MKVIFAFLLIAVGANALSQEYVSDDYSLTEERLVTNQIRRAIQQLRKGIKDAGLDPLVIEKFEGTVSPVPILFTITGLLDAFKFTGASNIAINRLKYGALNGKLRFDISLPQLSVSIGKAEVRANVFGTQYNGQLSGNLAITQLRLSGEIRVKIGIISGISLRNVDVKFRIQNIRSAFGAFFQDQEYSSEVNKFFNELIPKYLNTNKDQIDKYLSDLIKKIGNQILGKSLIEDENVLI